MTAQASFQEPWFQVLQRVEPEVKRTHFLTWFQHTAIMSLSDGLMIVGVPNVYAKQWLEDRLSQNIIQAVQAVLPEVKEIMYELHASLADPQQKMGIDVQKLFADKKRKQRKVPGRQEVRLVEGVSSKCLNPKYRLNSFVVGANNRLAHAACSAVSSAPGTLYNPLFIYGGVGLGKTHLLQATGNGILASDPTKVVVYMTSERFTNEIVDAIGKRNSKAFKDRYRKVDCLIIDDVQFLANKDRTQEEFFHTFNELYDNNKQIIISSDRPPKQLNALEDRLVSRFEMGMIVDVQFPDFETRLAILHSKCREHQAVIAPEVLEFIASNIHDSVRELEGVLIQLIAESQLQNTTPTLRSTAKIIEKLGRSISVSESAHMSIDNIRTPEEVAELVSDHFKISLDELMGSSRKRQIILPRQVAMYLIRNELNFAYEQIGDSFGGKNHTTVMHACEKVEKLIQKDKSLDRDVNAILKAMGKR